MRRHTCIVCGKKRYSDRMELVFASSYACHTDKDKCYRDNEITIAKEILVLICKLKKINLKHISGGR